MTTPVHTNKVEIEGVKFTSKWLLEKFMTPLYQPTSFSDLLKRLHSQMHKLSLLGIYKEFEVYIDVAEDDLENRESMPVDIYIKLKEKPRFFLKTGTEIGQSEANINATGIVRNVFGGGEILEAVATRGYRTRAAFELKLKKPLLGEPYHIFETFAQQLEKDWTESSSFVSLERNLGFNWKIPGNFGYHQWTPQLSLREFSEVAEKASVHIRDLPAESLKCSLQYIFTRDTRDDAILPMKGNLFRNTLEVAGYGSSKFIKNQVETQFCKSLRNFTLSTSLRFGLLYNLNQNEASPIYDRFFLGGPWDIRGFRTHGIGPKSLTVGFNQDALGGDAFWSAGVSLFTPFPFLQHWNFLKWHFFGNIGSLFPVHPTPSVQDSLGALIYQSSVAPLSGSFGTGLVWRSNFCRLELNLVWPWLKSRSDAIAGYSQSQSTTVEPNFYKPKFQVGIGIEFL